MRHLILFMAFNLSQPSLAIMNRPEQNSSAALSQVEIQVSCEILVYDLQGAEAGAITLRTPWFSAAASSTTMTITRPTGVTELRPVPVQTTPGFLFSEKGITLNFGDTEFNAESMLTGLVATPHVDLSQENAPMNDPGVEAYGSVTLVEGQKLWQSTQSVESPNCEIKLRPNAN